MRNVVEIFLPYVCLQMQLKAGEGGILGKGILKGQQSVTVQLLRKVSVHRRSMDKGMDILPPVI